MSNFITTIGIIKNNADPAEHGRLQIYIPSIDSRFYEVENLPWATYVSPFGGTTANFKVGRAQRKVPGISSYGFWAIPKIGGQVLCGFIDGVPQVRFWLGCIYVPEFNRTLPQSIDGGLTELDDSGVYPQAVIPHYQENLTKAGLQPGTIHYKTRGGYERSVSYPSNKTHEKNNSNGYAKKPLQPDVSDSQIFSMTTPGRHYFMMSDVDEYCRIRLKTTEGSQIILDDTNERIYISTAQGKNWIELDEGNGKIYIYSDSKINLRGKNDINIYSDENVNIVAKKRVNIKSEERSINLEAVHDVRVLSSQADVLLTASRDIGLKTLNGIAAPPLPEQTICSTDTKGLIYNWAEKGGSSTSSIYLDAAQSLHGRSLGSLNLTAATSLNVKSIGSDLNLQAGTNLNFNATAAANFTSIVVGLVAFDPSIGNLSITSLGTATPAETAAPATSVPSVEVVNHVLQPDHEPWVRDLDEEKCKTSRNAKYVG